MTLSANSIGRSVAPEHTVFRKLSATELPLAKRFYKEAAYRCRFDRASDVYVLYQHTSIVAAVQIDREEQFDFLRAMVVAPAHRGRGFGMQLLQHVAPLLDERSCWCLPYRALERLYQYAGFFAFATSNCPAPIKARLKRYQAHNKSLIAMCRSHRE